MQSAVAVLDFERNSRMSIPGHIIMFCTKKYTVSQSCCFNENREETPGLQVQFRSVFITIRIRWQLAVIAFKWSCHERSY